jgi:hypothetical protein
MSQPNGGSVDPGKSPAAENARAAPTSPQYPLMENMFAPEVFATFASSFSVGSGAVTIKLVSSRWDNSVEPGVQRAVVVGRITMPLQGAQTLVAGLQAFLAQHGLEYAPSARPRTRASDATAFSPNRESDRN